jgi:hypothetical protein
MKMAVFWVAARGLFIALMMDAANTFETAVHFCQTTRPKNAAVSRLQIRRHGNLKFHLNLMNPYWDLLWCFTKFSDCRGFSRRSEGNQIRGTR